VVFIFKKINVMPTLKQQMDIWTAEFILFGGDPQRPDYHYPTTSLIGENKNDGEIIGTIEFDSENKELNFKPI